MRHRDMRIGSFGWNWVDESYSMNTMYDLTSGLRAQRLDSLREQLTDEDFREDTLVLVMEQIQREKVLEKYENANPEDVYVLTELTGDELEILDPYGGTLQSYGLCYETMRKTIRKLAALLNETEE